MSLKPYYDEAGITIYHGDCREVLPGMTADLLCADPNYGLGAARRNFGGNGVRRHMTGLCAGKAIPKTDYGDSFWDDEPCPSDLLDLCRAAAPQQIIWGGNYFNLPKARCWLIWDKLRGDTDYADAEMAWTNLDRAVRIIRWRWNGFLQENQDAKEVRVHPTQKPLAVIKWALLQAEEWSTVLDPFMGSGTTLRAAKDLGRRAIGIEIEEKYCEIAAKRLAQEVFTWP
jgi:DNA modification methylase